MPKLVEENTEMKAKIASLENELSILGWYHQVLEKGLNMEQIIKEYAELTSKYEDMEATKDVEIKKLQSENRKLNKRIDSAMKNLSK